MSRLDSVARLRGRLAERAYQRMCELNEDDHGQVVARPGHFSLDRPIAWTAWERSTWLENLVAAKRSFLIGQVEQGAIETSDADRQALHFGFELSSGPDPDDWNPMVAADWTLVMAIAWIATRSVSFVRENWIEVTKRSEIWREGLYRIASGEDRTRTGSTTSLVQPPNPTIDRLTLWDSTMTDSADRPPIPSGQTFSGAGADLLNALRTGKIRAIGINKKGASKTIKKGKWRDLAFETVTHDDRQASPGKRLNGLDDEDIVRSRPGTPPAVFTRVTLLREDVLALWPELTPAQAQAAKSVADRTTCTKRLTDLMRAQRKPNAEDTKAALRDRLCPGLPKNAFEHAWKAAVTETGSTAWSESGRRSIKRNT